jgi:hypothetical protein
LSAALEVATGKIIASHSKRRRRGEFLGFMNSVVVAFPDNELHAILDNLNTHKKHIDAFITAYNETAEPFAWTKKKVYRRRFKNRHITQL